MTSTVESNRNRESIERLSPDALMEGFVKSHLPRWFLVALAAHALVIGAFSLGTIRDLVDPEGAAARKAARTAAAAPAEAPAEAAAAPPAASPPVADAPADQAAAADGKTPIEKATTEAAAPKDIPAKPDDLGLSIEDTNPR